LGVWNKSRDVEVLRQQIQTKKNYDFCTWAPALLWFSVYVLLSFFFVSFLYTLFAGANLMPVSLIASVKRQTDIDSSLFLPFTA
jgi:hypothetical protein